MKAGKRHFIAEVVNFTVYIYIYMYIYVSHSIISNFL